VSNNSSGIRFQNAAINTTAQSAFCREVSLPSCAGKPKAEIARLPGVSRQYDLWRNTAGDPRGGVGKLCSNRPLICGVNLQRAMTIL
jgi:hypothetical protein